MILVGGIRHIRKAYKKRQANKDAEQSQAEQSWTQDPSHAGQGQQASRQGYSGDPYLNDASIQHRQEQHQAPQNK